MVAITHPAALPLAPRTGRPAGGAATAYRRRRLAVLGALLVLLALASVGAHTLVGRATGAVPAGVGGRTPQAVASVAVVVGPGDTVWSIAARLADGDDPRPVVDAIAEANGGSSLVAGQRLEVVLP